MRNEKIRWQTSWIVIGPKLPESEITLFNGVYIAPLSDLDFGRIKMDDKAQPVLNLDTDNYVIRYPSRDTIQSRYRLQIDVPDVDEQDACNHAREIANLILTSLTLIVPGGRYQAVFRRLRRYGDTEEKSPWSESSMLIPLSKPDLITKIDTDRAVNLYNKIECSNTAILSYENLLTAWTLRDTPGNKPLQRAILQNYVLSIEGVVNGVMSLYRSRRTDRIKQLEREFAEQWVATLSQRADKPAMIREASTKLRGIGFQNTLPSIDKVASILNLPNDIRDEAKELYKFRSSSISHPKRVREKDVEKWLYAGTSISDISKADKVARCFLIAYCEWDEATGLGIEY